MTTARDIIDRAMRRIGVLAEDEQLTAAQASNGLESLNDMMHEWITLGIEYQHFDLSMLDDFPMDDRWRSAAVALLAERLAPDYGVAAPSAERHMRALQAGLMRIDELVMPVEFWPRRIGDD